MIFKIIGARLRYFRYKYVKQYIIGENILEVGSSDAYLKKIINNKNVVCSDIIPKHNVEVQNVEKLAFNDNSFDTVLCMEVLEHVDNPINALKELKRVNKKRLIISVPYEPWYTLWRLLIWEKEHVWSIRPSIFKKNLGSPTMEKTIILGRYYVGIWDKNVKKNNS